MRGQSIRVSAEKLGLKDHKEISQSLRELVLSSGIKKNEIADLTLDQIQDFAAIYLKESGRTLWGPKTHPLRWPQQEDKIKPQIVEILLRQKENQIDIRNRLANPSEGSVDHCMSRENSVDSDTVIYSEIRPDSFPAAHRMTTKGSTTQRSAITLHFLNKQSANSNSLPSAGQQDPTRKQINPAISTTKKLKTEYSNPPESIQQTLSPTQTSRKRTFDSYSDLPTDLSTSRLHNESGIVRSMDELIDLTSQDIHKSPSHSLTTNSRAHLLPPRTPNLLAQPGSSASPKQGAAATKSVAGNSTEVSQEVKFEVSDLTYCIDTRALPEIMQGIFDRLDLAKLEHRKKIRKLAGEDAAAVKGNLEEVKSLMADIVADMLSKGGRVEE